MKQYGCQSMVAPIRRLLLKHPREAYQNQSKIDAQWQALHYTGHPDYEVAMDEYEGFLSLIKQFDIETHFLPADEDTSLDSVYVHDPVLVSHHGAILCNMGKEARKPEATAVERYLASIGVPVLGYIEPPGSLEGGDVVWLDERTVAIGEGYRSNAEGIRQFRELLGDLVDEVISVPLPHWTGEADCLHLMSFLSPIDDDLAVVYSRLMSVPFRKMLIDRGIELVEVPDEEYDTFAPNVLPVAPRKCIMLSGNPVTQARLEAAGAEVWTYDGVDISLKGTGGPTCLTRPLLRE